jgi:hypothetical protein
MLVLLKDGFIKYGVKRDPRGLIHIKIHSGIQKKMGDGDTHWQ